MDPLVPIVSIAVAFAAIFLLNREGKRVRREVGALHSIGIAVIALVSVRAAFHLRVQYVDPYSLPPLAQVLITVAGALLVLKVLQAVFRRRLGLSSSAATSLDERNIHICYGGDIEYDRAFAISLRSRLSPRAPAEVSLFDIHAFERREDDYEPSAAAGTFIYVISEPFLSDGSILGKLLETAQKAGIPGYMYFYICRGTSYQRLFEDHPQLKLLGDRVMVGDETQLDTMIEQVAAHATLRPVLMRRLRRTIVPALTLAYPGVLAGMLLPLFYAAAPLVWFTLLLSAFTSGVASQVPDYLLALAAGQYTALLVHRQRALDFWPFLGSCFRSPLNAQDVRELRIAPGCVLGFRIWLDQTSARRQNDLHDDGLLTREQSSRSLLAWSGLLLESRVYTLVVLFGGGIPMLLFARDTSNAIGWLVFGGALGLIIPAWVAWSQLLTKRIGYWRLGVTAEELARTSQFFRDDVRGTLLSENQSYRSQRMARSWFRQKPRVFISYSWLADEKQGLAPALHGVLTSLGIDHFYDRESIRSSFASWRASVADALVCSTHVFVLLQEDAPVESVHHREVQTAIQRLYTDILPAFVCVADPQTVRALLARQDLPVELRWLLEWAPRISPSEAADPRMIAHVIRQRSRQGRLRDACTLLFPTQRLREFVGRDPIN